MSGQRQVVRLLYASLLRQARGEIAAQQAAHALARSSRLSIWMCCAREPGLKGTTLHIAEPVNVNLLSTGRSMRFEPNDILRGFVHAQLARCSDASDGRQPACCPRCRSCRPPRT